MRTHNTYHPQSAGWPHSPVPVTLLIMDSPGGTPLPLAQLQLQTVFIKVSLKSPRSKSTTRPEVIPALLRPSLESLMWNPRFTKELPSFHGSSGIPTSLHQVRKSDSVRVQAPSWWSLIFMSLSQADNICKEQDLRSSHHFILKVTSHLFYKSLQFLGHALYAWRIIQHGNVGGRLLPALDTTSVTLLAWQLSPGSLLIFVGTYEVRRSNSLCFRTHTLLWRQ
ncbi:uncharacterized protein LOC105297041 [Pteropus vampyrus]|uniref:Uncharacterized protein LOC105297041 n=1 Tax=Pteropus vampyrus TaxID=132908 RepID=A0A6P6CTB9_PTEVA|nr:uncharacterized protein LOC105297041 [Pteropus vampyrus]